MMTLVKDELSRLQELAELYTSTQQFNDGYPLGAESIGWGILGASNVAGAFMIPAIRSQPSASLSSRCAGSWVVGIFSHNERLARQFADEHQIPQTYVNLTDLLARREIRCIYIASHPRHHFPLAMAALSAGKHVLCEPPLALTVDDANTLAMTASNRGLLLSLNYTQRAHAPMQMVRKLLAHEAIGTIVGGRIINTVLLPPRQQTWRLQGNGGGVIFDQSIHDIDLLRYLLNDEIQQIYAATPLSRKTSATTQTDEDVLIHLDFKRLHLIFHLHNSFLIGHTTSGLEIYGTQGSLWADQWAKNAQSNSLYVRRRNQIEEIPTPYIDPFWYAIYRFNLTVREDHPPLTTALDGVLGVEVSLAIRRSIQERSPLPVGTIENR